MLDAGVGGFAGGRQRERGACGPGETGGLWEMILVGCYVEPYVGVRVWFELSFFGHVDLTRRLRDPGILSLGVHFVAWVTMCLVEWYDGNVGYLGKSDSREMQVAEFVRCFVCVLLYFSSWFLIMRERIGRTINA